MTRTARPRLAILFVALAALALCFSSTPVGAQDGSVPDKPTGLSTAASHDRVNLTWDDPNDASITHHQIFRRNRDVHAAGEFVTIASNTGSTAARYRDDTVEPETRYVYRVKAVNAHGASKWSSFASANTPAAPPQEPDPTPTPAPTPEPELEPTPESLAPSGLTAGTAGGGVALSWDAPAEDPGSVTGYEILRGPSEDALTTLVADTSSTDTAYTDETATEEGETYLYQVKALRDGEKSQGSNLAGVVIPTVTSTLIEPEPPVAAFQSVADDRAALVALYDSTDGANWTNNTNWDTTATLGNWYGVETNSNGRVTGLELTGNNLVGTLPADLGDLDKLKLLYLNNNALSGTIPAELGDLENLSDLILSSNGLGGAIPAELGDLSKLKYLSLNGNQLNGAIPAELGDLSLMVELILSYNGLTGAIPAELGDLSNLRSLALEYNQLSGAIPSELGDLSKLKNLDLTENQLSGVIPAELGDLSMLDFLGLSGNADPSVMGSGLTGAIPAELGSLTNLTDLRLNSNRLSEEIPASMGSLTELTILLLQGNQLSGEIPASMGNLTKLIVLSMHSNQLSGAIPASMGSLTNLAIVRFFANNSLTGCVPEGLGYLLTAPDYSGLPPHDFGLDANNDGDYDDPGDTPPLCIPVPTAVTGLSLVAVIASDVGTGQTFYGNALSWDNERCDGLGYPDDPIQYLWRIKHNGEVIEDAAIVTERDGKCVYSHTDYYHDPLYDDPLYDGPLSEDKFGPGVMHLYEVTTLKVRMIRKFPGFEIVEESPPATIFKCADDPRGITGCWLGDDVLDATNVFARRYARGEVQITWDSVTNHGALFDNDEVPDGESQYALTVAGGKKRTTWPLASLPGLFGDPTGRGNSYTVVHPTSTAMNDNDVSFTYTLRLVGQPWPSGETFLKIACPVVGSFSSVSCNKVPH